MNKLVYMCICLLFTACGSVAEEKITIEMYGVNELAASSSGDTAPINQTYTLNSVILANADGEYELFSTPTDFKIINRRQIIISESTKTHSGTTFTSMQLIFEPQILTTSANTKDVALTLTNPTISYSKEFTIATKKELTFLLKVLWKDTVTTSDSGEDATTEPDFSIESE